MSVSIGQYIETLQNPAGRFRTLEGIYPCLNDDGTPSHRTHRSYVDFDVCISASRAVLRAPLRSDSSLGEMRILAARLARMHSPYLLPFEFREAEMTVLDASMRPRQVDVCIQMLPQHTTLEEFLRTQSASGSTADTERIVPRLIELVFWARKNSIGITPSAIIVTQSDKGCMPRMTSVPKIDLSAQVVAAAIASLLAPHSYMQFGRQILLHPRALGKSAELFSAIFRGTPYEEISTLASGCDRETFDTALKRIAAYSHEDFCNMARLLTDSSLSFPQPVCDADRPDAADAFAHYYRIERGGEDTVCAMDGEGWKYVDPDGKQLFPQRFRYAMPFREGRAEVETETGKGLIDRQGEYLLPPEYEEVCWDEYHGIVVVMRYGKWSLRNRDGKPVGREHFDYIGEFSEGLAAVMRGGKWGFVDTDGKIALPLKYDDASSFSGGEALVSENGREFTIDRLGTPANRKQDRALGR